MDKYKTLTNSFKFIGSQPVTFNKENYNKKLYYFTSYKLDGKRKLLILTNDKKGLMYSQKMEVETFTLPTRPELNNTMLDCEFFKGKVYVFDILFYKGEDVRNKIFNKRLEMLKETNKILKSKRVLLKEYLSPYDNTICKNFYTIKNKYKDDMVINGTVDGIIFTPDTGYTGFNVLKWKPSTLLTIDFKIKKIKGGENDYKLALLTHKGTVFKPKGNGGNNVGISSVSKEEYNKFNDGDVVEFMFINGEFKPLKIRRDKVNSNYITVIFSNYNTILNPPDMKKILNCTK